MNKELLFEYEKYTSKILGVPHLFLISNDAHFDEIKESGLIEVWKISEAICKIL